MRPERSYAGRQRLLSEGETIQPNPLVWRVLAVLWMALIFALSSAWFAPKMSFDATLDFFGQVNYVVRKMAHAGEFGVLTWLWFRALYPDPLNLDRGRLYSGLIALVYAASDEYHQTFVPLRSGKATDVLFDAAGILAVVWLISRACSWENESLRRLLLGETASR
ncbi:TPA: hypothetical protein DCE37_00445 [Candidatus Latescibacteria bacterium]|nr:hypothetical protein [Candidatus Latescibacterota bacterium]